MNSYTALKQQLLSKPSAWLITGVAGFIGSNLLETLLNLNQKVVGLDNFATGHRHNFDKVQYEVSTEQWDNFTFIEGDIRSLEDCRQACEGADYVLHQAALCSISSSLEDPINTNENNITGFLNMLVAARDVEVERFVYAASSSTYGEQAGLPKIENRISNPLSPYAVTKVVNEQYARVFASCYDFKSIGLRYFNIFGRRQDPNGPYAAVIPKWVASMIQDKEVIINGDGQTSRDFCYVDNAVQANLLAATTTNPDALDQIYNVAVGDRTSLNQLYEKILAILVTDFPQLENITPIYRDFRPDDVKHSLADISKIRNLLGYEPTHPIDAGLKEAMSWYLADLKV